MLRVCGGARLGDWKGYHPMAAAPQEPPRAWQQPWLSQAGAGLSVLPFTLQTGAAPGLGETAVGGGRGRAQSPRGGCAGAVTGG